MEVIEGVTYFKDIKSEDKHQIFVEIGKGIDKCRECPITIRVGSSYCNMDEREELCGGCDNYQHMRALASQLPDYDLTRRQRQLLNKTADTITNSELEELFYSGVPKAIISRAMGFKQKGLTKFEQYLIEKGASVPRGYRPNHEEQQEFQTMNLRE